ncbi:hypothetical protein A462_24088 [Pseudomonas sp. Ag1]|jgi:hypothetical protein|uniref:GTPase-associated system all-helical protein GASH n=1 Tax=Pseudomonas sp. Ag1 TaxID=1197727 RepID=UPI000272C40C|nr:GTPase-associated system all-helical protein GASH [Pseudomonas sp. Ag1]EJF69448.1 hypothetical protein A462_24088 [Pseudomonas sp. Ag1]
MENIAVYMRITSVSVSDDDVSSRRTSAASLATAWGKESDILKLVTKATDIAKALSGDGRPSMLLGEEVQKVIQKKSASYLYDERPMDVGVCAGVAMLSLLNKSAGTSGYQIVDIYAAALWSALGYQHVLEDARREKLRRDVFDAAVKRSRTSAEKARTRLDVSDPSGIKIAIGADGAPTNNISDVLNLTVEALRRNAALDREELDFLWWAQLGRSRILNRQLSAITEPARIVSAGIEGAKMLRRLPCDVHREIVLRTLDQDPELDLSELLEAIGDDRELLGAEFTKGNVMKYPTIFPLLHALATGELDSVGATLKRPVSEWGERALMEAGFVKLIAHGPAHL